MNGFRWFSSVPRRWLVPLVVVVLAGAALASGCERNPERQRCAQCGMYVDIDPGFTASADDAVYDTPKCLWRAIEAGEAQVGEAQVTEYYSRKPIPAAEATYVLGSDVLGPMGADLIPVGSREAAERFVRDHGGRVVAPGEIDGGILKGL